MLVQSEHTHHLHPSQATQHWRCRGVQGQSGNDSITGCGRRSLTVLLCINTQWTVVDGHVWRNGWRNRPSVFCMQSSSGDGLLVSLWAPELDFHADERHRARLPRACRFDGPQLCVPCCSLQLQATEIHGVGREQSRVRAVALNLQGTELQSTRCGSRTSGGFHASPENTAPRH